MQQEYKGFKDLVGKRNVWFAISIIVVLIGIISLALPQRRLNVGVDFTGGFLLNYPAERKITASEVEKIVNEIGFKHNPVQVMYGGQEFMLRMAGYKEDERDAFYAKMKAMKIKFRLAFTDTKPPAVELRFLEAVPGSKVIEDALAAAKISGVGVGEITSTRNAQKEGERESYNVIVKLTGASGRETYDKAATAIYDKLDGFELTAEKGEVEVSPMFSAELFRRAALALIIATICILVYITIRFEFWFAIAGIIALVHDCLITLGFYSVLQLEVNSAFVAIILTVFGYSINDTIIIFDRIRENMRKDRKTPLHQLVNQSLWETMPRSINTVMTTQLTVLAVILFGGASIRDFALGLFIGIGTGAFSSIFVAAPLAFIFKSFDKKDERAAAAQQAQQYVSKKKEKKAAKASAPAAQTGGAAEKTSAPASSGSQVPSTPKSADGKKKDSGKGKQRRR